jgi:NAD(P)-dependent dehydrogenase (short-subunit alcohol dehydrogenase family)
VTSDDDLREELERVPLGRPAKREDAEEGAIELASSSSEHVTGKTIAIDGGLTRA